MAEALEKAKQALGLSQKGENPAPQPAAKNANAELEAALAMVDNIDARELIRAKVRQITAEATLQAKEAEKRAQQMDGDGAPREENRNGDEKQSKKKELVTNALILIEKGVDADIVARYILGSEGGNLPINLGGGQQQGMTVADVIKIVDLVKSNNQPDTKMAEAIIKLTEKIDLMGKKPNQEPVDPAEAVVAPFKALNSTIDALVGAGLVQRPGTSNPGKSLEELKEENRHNEELQKLKTEKEYKEGLVETLGGIPERIGHGIASQTRMSGGGGKKAPDSPLETFKCSNGTCGATIIVTPETGDHVKCAKCGMVYERGEEKPAAAAPPAAPAQKPAEPAAPPLLGRP